MVAGGERKSLKGHKSWSLVLKERLEREGQVLSRSCHLPLVTFSEDIFSECQVH